jgi:hypothetical protein
MNTLKTQISTCSSVAKLVEHEPTIDNKNELHAQCEILYKLLSSSKYSHAKHIISYGHYTELRMIKNAMLFHIKFFRSIHDRLFSKIFKGFTFKVKWMTMLFKEFVKGITYFANHGKHSDGDVAYHRPESCHYKRQIELLHCTENNKEWSDSIQRCLIERLIYDKLFAEETLFFPAIGTEESVVQDKNHLDMLNDMINRYKVCFPNVRDINVNIHYGEFKYPVRLMIKITYKNGTYLQDTFEKSLTLTSLKSGYPIYSTIVVCNRIDTRRRIVEVFNKIQSYRNEVEWKTIDQPNKKPYNIQRSASIGGRR